MTVIPGPSNNMTIPIHSKGRYFFKGDQRVSTLASMPVQSRCGANSDIQFLIKGVVYRLHGEGPIDPLVDDRLDDLQRDITLFKELGLNTLFVCESSPEPLAPVNHMACPNAGSRPHRWLKEPQCRNATPSRSRHLRPHCEYLTSNQPSPRGGYPGQEPGLTIDGRASQHHHAQATTRAQPQHSAHTTQNYSRTVSQQ